VSQLASDVCVKVQWHDCQVQSGIYFADYTIYNQSFPIGQITKVLAQGTCVQSPILNCQTCLTWNHVTLNDTTATGCGTMNFQCLGENLGDYSVGCFADSNVVPQCFICPTNCSNHGTCDKGTCICNGEYTGNDCSVIPQPCGMDCGNHGSCTNGVCACDKYYAGPQCQSYIGEGGANSSNTGTTGGPSTAVMVVVPLLLILFVAAVIAGFVYWKKRKQPTKFFQLEIHEDEEIEPVTPAYEMNVPEEIVQENKE